MRLASWLLCAVALSACGGSGSPTSPSSSTSNSCMPQTAQCLIDGATLGITLNGVDVSAGSTQSVTTVSSFSLRFAYVNTSGQAVSIGFLFVRDDGLQGFAGCLDLAGAVTAATVALTAPQISPADPMFAPGRTVRALLVSRLGGLSASGAQCALRTSGGQFDPLLVQAQRQLVTFALQ